MAWFINEQLLLTTHVHREPLPPHTPHQTEGLNALQYQEGGGAHQINLEPTTWPSPSLHPRLAPQSPDKSPFVPIEVRTADFGSDTPCSSQATLPSLRRGPRIPLGTEAEQSPNCPPKYGIRGTGHEESS